MTFTFQRVFHMFWFVDANCPSSNTELEVHESEPSLLSSWVGNFFFRGIYWRIIMLKWILRNRMGGQGLNVSQDRDK
jgi:hypothetical protein